MLHAPTARPAWSVIDLDALAHNVRVIRSMLRPTDRFYAVCKNNAYGCGAAECAATMLANGADAFAVSDPEDAERLRAARVKVPILLYASTTPAMASAVAELDLIATVHDFSSLQAFERLRRPVKVHVELDCGYGRLGFVPREWPEALTRLAGAAHIQVVGLYTHLTAVEKPEAVAIQQRLFAQAAQEARDAGLRHLELMAASSRVMLGYPELSLNAVNPGRMLFGMIEDPWQGRVELRPVVKAVKSRVLQVKTIPASFDLDDPRHRAAPGQLRTAVIAFGFKDGLPREPAGGTVLVRGQRARIIGLRATEHTVIDVSDVAGVEPGDEVVILGRQGEQEITAHEVVAMYKMAMIELLARMTLNTPRIYEGI
jgi:alanine racemase